MATQEEQDLANQICQLASKSPTFCLSCNIRVLIPIQVASTVTRHKAMRTNHRPTLLEAAIAQLHTLEGPIEVVVEAVSTAAIDTEH